MREKWFRLIDKHTRHDGTAWDLYDTTGDRYISALYSPYHGAYQCDVTIIDYDTDTETTDYMLLTDADLNDCILRD